MTAPRAGSGGQERAVARPPPPLWRGYNPWSHQTLALLFPSETHAGNRQECRLGGPTPSGSLPLMVSGGLFIESHQVEWAMQWVCVLSGFSRVRLFATLWTVARQAPLSIRFSRQNTGVGCHAPLQGMFLSEIEPTSLTSPASAGGFFTTSTTWEALSRCLVSIVSVQRAYCIILLIPQKKRPSLPLWMQESGGSESLSDLPEVRNRYKSLSLD